MEEADVVKFNSILDLFFDRYINNEESHLPEKCYFCKEKNIEIDIENEVKVFLSYLDKDMLRFIHKSDTIVDNFSNRNDALKYLEIIRKENKIKFSPKVAMLLERIYAAEVKLISETNLSDFDKIYYRAQSWLWSTIVCINSNGFDYLKNNFDNWHDTVVHLSLVLMILDDILDIREDEKNNHPNSIILSKGKVLYFFDFECPHERIGNFVFLKDRYDINHLSVNCFSALMENQHVKIQIRKLFDVLKDFVKS